MGFTSPVFLVFVVLYFLPWRLVRQSNRLRWTWITLFSLIFYGWWNWRYVFLFLATGFVDFLAALAIDRWKRHRKSILLVSLSSNIAVLGFFKYAGFFADLLNNLSSYFELNAVIRPIHILLPVGISFYTFQSMSYVIDVYRGEIKPARNPLHFFAFLSLFSQLVAGPIVRGKDLLPQLETYNPTTDKDGWDGLRLVAYGYFKKLFIADNLILAVRTAAGSGDVHPSAVFWWVALALLAIHIYADFSGYSDIARGLTRWMGYDLPTNFNHPLSKSTSLSDFWNRWHITLTTWFRDYVYKPLGGGFHRFSPRAHFNLWITMGLIGLWHGASWNFVLFGLWHAFFLSVERVTQWPRWVRFLPFGRVLVSFIVFVEFLLIGVWFVLPSVDHALSVWMTLIDWQAYRDFRAVLELGTLPLTVAMVAIAIEILIVQVRASVRFQSIVRGMEPVFVGVAIAVSIFFRGPGADFVYFQF